MLEAPEGVLGEALRKGGAQVGQDNPCRAGESLVSFLAFSRGTLSEVRQPGWMAGAHESRVRRRF